MAANCRTDADDAGRYCSPSFGECDRLGGIVAFNCHTGADECIDASTGIGPEVPRPKKGHVPGPLDARPRPGYCVYRPDVGHGSCRFDHLRRMRW